MAKFSEVLRALYQVGWYTVSQSGSHVKLIHPQRKDFIIFPNHGAKEVAPGLLKALKKQAGIHYRKIKNK
jgi:predicted RNA binding protein YcfA (HicA-like mRNA interferase family)